MRRRRRSLRSEAAELADLMSPLPWVDQVKVLYGLRLALGLDKDPTLEAFTHGLHGPSNPPVKVP
jgi:hypothetical protein